MKRILVSLALILGVLVAQSLADQPAGKSLTDSRKHPAASPRCV